MEKIELYLASDCSKCIAAENNLRKILKERGIHFDDAVSIISAERDTSAMRVGNMYLSKVPMLRRDSKTLRGDDLLNESKLRAFLSDL